MDSANCFADPKLGSISSLRCQISRTSQSIRTSACEVMFRGRYSLSSQQPVFALSGYDEAAFATKGLPSRSWLLPAKAGGARRDRTDDLMLAKHALSQLSYDPLVTDHCELVTALVGLGRLELPTSRLSSARSNQLSYKPGRKLPVNSCP